MFWEGLAGELEVGFEHLHGVSGAALLGLQDELDASGGDGCTDAVGFVADDAEDMVGGNCDFGGGDDVEEEGAATDLVEDFGAFAFEAGAFSGGHDGDGEFVGVHMRTIVSWSRCVEKPRLMRSRGRSVWCGGA